MTQFFSPGVYIQEVPPQLRAIEGVSTSVAGVVGLAPRGPVAGFPLPFVPSAPTTTQPFVLLVPRDSAPVLVTSLSEYLRTFGPLPAAPTVSDRNFLGHAVRAFFDNGGRLTYVARIVADKASNASGTLFQGTALRLTAKAKSLAATASLDSLRGVSVGTVLVFATLSGATDKYTVLSYNTQSGTVTVKTPFTQDYGVDDTFVTIDGAIPAVGGPQFWARSPGSWGSNLEVLVSNSDRAPTPITAPVAASTVIQVQTTASIYVGAILEVDHGGTSGTREYVTVARIISSTRVQVDRILTLTLPASPAQAFARVVEVDITIVDSASGVTETYEGLTWGINLSLWPSIQASVQSRHYANVINARSSLVYAQPPGVLATPALVGSETFSTSSATVPINLQPQSHTKIGALDAYAFPQALSSGGSDGNALADSDFVGVDLGPGQRTGFQALQDVASVSIVAVPGETANDIQQALITQCETLRYRFAVLDGEQGPPNDVTTIQNHRNNYASSYAGYYVPWVQFDNGVTTIDLPPSGYAMGIYARVDNSRGVWKAPANEPLRNITGLSTYVTAAEQDELNPVGVNCIRRFPGRGILIWGARTLSPDSDTKYINVRRFLIFLEHSLDMGTQWAVFEPNSPPTWSRLTDSVAAFLHTQWRDGALFGSKPEEAFYVRCDETTMSADDVLNGRLICEIGVAIVRPAEFVIFRIEQISGFSTASS